MRGGNCCFRKKRLKKSTYGDKSLNKTQKEVLVATSLFIINLVLIGFLIATFEEKLLIQLLAVALFLAPGIMLYFSEQLNMENWLDVDLLKIFLH